MNSTSAQFAPIEDSTPPLTAHNRMVGYALASSLALHLLAFLIVIVGLGISPRHSPPQAIFVDTLPLPSPPSQTISSPETETTVAQPEAAQEQTPLPNEPDITMPPTASPAHTEQSSLREAVTSTELGLGMAHGYISSLADGTTLREDIRGYYFELVSRINREWWQRAENLKQPVQHDGLFELLVQKDGTVLAMRLRRGTGSREADAILQEVLAKVSPLPPLPPTYEDTIFVAPIRLKAPSILFGFKNLL